MKMRIMPIFRVEYYDYEVDEYYYVCRGTYAECKAYIDKYGLNIASDPSVLNDFHFVCYKC